LTTASLPPVASVSVFLPTAKAQTCKPQFSATDDKGEKKLEFLVSWKILCGKITGRSNSL